MPTPVRLSAVVGYFRDESNQTFLAIYDETVKRIRTSATH
jgi:hypothetical protein